MRREVKHKVLKQREKIVKTLDFIIEESNAPATYYVLDKICDKMALPVPSTRKIVKTLKEKGFEATATHFNPKGIRTNAKAAMLIEIVEESK